MGEVEVVEHSWSICQRCGAEIRPKTFPSGRVEAPSTARKHKFCSPECRIAQQRSDAARRHPSRHAWNEGCRCDLCSAWDRKRRARAARAEVRALALASASATARANRVALAATHPEVVPHGTANGYNNWGCRCDACRIAKAAEGVAIRARRAASNPENIPHGTANGYAQWGCRCEACTKAHNDRTVHRSNAKNSRSQEWAVKRGQQWTGPELEIALRDDLTAVEAAKILGRSFSAIQHARARSRRDPRYIKLAGTSRNGSEQ